MILVKDTITYSKNKKNKKIKQKFSLFPKKNFKKE